MSYVGIPPIFFLCVFIQSYSMEQPLQPPHKYNLASFSGLPADVKEYLLPFVVSGTLKDMTRGLYNLALLDKEWINNPNRIIKILNTISRLCVRVTIIERLKNKKTYLPVMSSEPISSYCNNLKSNLKHGVLLTNALRDYRLQRVAELLHLDNLDLNYEDGWHGSPLAWTLTGTQMSIQETWSLLTFKQFLAAGADPNTAVNAAVYSGNIIALRILLEEGATFGSTDNVNNLLKFAEIKSYMGIADLLKQELQKRHNARDGKQGWCEIL